MGASVSFMNIWALAQIIRTIDTDILIIISEFEQKQQQKIVAEIADEDPDENEVIIINYEITEEILFPLLIDHRISDVDQDLLRDMFRIIDNRGRRRIDLRDLLISFAILTARDVHHYITIVFELYDRKKVGFVDRQDLIHLSRLINDTCFYVGDKYLDNNQVLDLIDSIYTTSGKTGGELNYSQFIDYLCTHPIIEMFISPQFQGPAREKILDNDTIESMVYADR